jgi:RNA polymerase sigma-70 factor, ECF subfamily
MRRDLVEQARRGDHDAFAVLAGAAISRLDATAWLMLRDPDRAMDAVQTALIRAWRDLPALRDPDRFDAWLYRLVIRACTDEIRQVRRHRLDVDISEITTGPAVPDATSAVADRDQIERGFRRLGPEERAVIVLHHYLDLPLPEVASTLQIPLGTVKSRLYRGLGQMRAVLDADARPGADVREGHPA